MPIFLSSEEVQTLQLSQIDVWGGQHGLRDPGALESAIAAPQHHFIYGSGDLFDFAAALMFALITNHPFLDGNKRVGTLAAAPAGGASPTAGSAPAATSGAGSSGELPL